MIQVLKWLVRTSALGPRQCEQGKSAVFARIFGEKVFNGTAGRMQLTSVNLGSAPRL